jgi:DNA-binding transcriptional LysR family regulator
MIPTETEISHFLELYSARNFTRAALGLGITQPTLTQSMVRLEEKVKARLFHRSKQGCVPTKAAESFFNKATQLQELWLSLSTQIVDAEKSMAGVFRIGCHESVGIYTLPRFVKSIAEYAPLIDIRIQHDWSRRIVEKIINYELDLGFVVNPIKHRDLVLIKIGTDQIALWRAKKSEAPPRRLLTDLDLNQVQKLFGKHRIAEFKDWPIVETPSLEVVRAMTLEGAGIGILPERVASAGKMGLEIVKSSLPAFKDEIYVAYRAGTLKGLAGKAVIDAAKRCIDS